MIGVALSYRKQFKLWVRMTIRYNHITSYFNNYKRKKVGQNKDLTIKILTLILTNYYNVENRDKGYLNLFNLKALRTTVMVLIDIAPAATMGSNSTP